MAKNKIPTTSAIRYLKANKVPFTLHSYDYEERGGTSLSARELGVDENLVIKTLVMEDNNKNPLIILMNGDKEVSTKNLARTLGVKTITPCNPDIAKKHTGYLVGGTSPFGTRKQLKICVEESILSLPKIYINAGKRGLLAEMSPSDLKKTLNPIAVMVGI